MELWSVLVLWLSSMDSLAMVTGYPTMCSPKLWEGKRWTLQITHTDQGPDVWESTSEFSVDVTGQRLASRETGIRHGQHYDIFYLYYYPANTLFTVQDGQCQTSNIERGIKEQCTEMPDEHAVEYLTELMPSFPNGTFCGGVRGERKGVGYFHSVNTGQQGNVPLMEETQGVIQGVPTYILNNYYNVTVGIRDPGIFTPPDNCIKGQAAVDVGPGKYRPQSFFRQ